MEIFADDQWSPNINLPRFKASKRTMCIVKAQPRSEHLIFQFETINIPTVINLESALINYYPKFNDLDRLFVEIFSLLLNNDRRRQWFPKILTWWPIYRSFAIHRDFLIFMRAMAQPEKMCQHLCKLFHFIAKPGWRITLFEPYNEQRQ